MSNRGLVLRKPLSRLRTDQFPAITSLEGNFCNNFALTLMLCPLMVLVQVNIEIQTLMREMSGLSIRICISGELCTALLQPISFPISDARCLLPPINCLLHDTSKLLPPLCCLVFAASYLLPFVCYLLCAALHKSPQAAMARKHSTMIY